jgi:multisubunit Na+/H+ antiporter MnhF subunit
VTAESIAMLALLAGMVLTGLTCARAKSPVDRLVALELGSVVATLVLLLLALFMHRPGFVDLALVMGLLSLASGLVFVRSLERWV